MFKRVLSAQDSIIIKETTTVEEKNNQFAYRITRAAENITKGKPLGC